MHPMQTMSFECRVSGHRDHLDLTEVRFSQVGDGGEIEGYAVKFDVRDSYGTSFDRRAFVWDGRSLPLLWSHRADDVVGSIRSVTADDQGLKIAGRLNLEVQRAREVRAMLMAGDIDGLSIGFRRIKDEPRAGVRHITEARLVEVSFVAVPSVPGASVTAVRHQSSRASETAFVRAVREAVRSFSK